MLVQIQGTPHTRQHRFLGTRLNDAVIGHADLALAENLVHDLAAVGIQVGEIGLPGLCAVMTERLAQPVHGRAGGVQAGHGLRHLRWLISRHIARHVDVREGLPVCLGGLAARTQRDDGDVSDVHSGRLCGPGGQAVTTGILKPGGRRAGATSSSPMSCR